MTDEQLDLFGHDVRRAATVADTSAIRCGDAGEALARYRLLGWGYDVSEAGRGLAYDLLVADGGRFIRVQVKSAQASGNGRWDFRLQRGFHASRKGVYDYSDADFDIAAFAALSIDRVLFVPGVVPSFTARTPDFLRPDAEFESWARAIAVLTGRPPAEFPEH